MQNKNRKLITLVTWMTIILMSLLITLPAPAGDYAIVWSTIDGGGGRSSNGPYVLTGTIGQPDADFSSGGGYELLGGFWPGGPLCFVAFDDFARFAQMWLIDDTDGDLDGDSDIDFGDVRKLANNWLLYCPYNWPLK